MFLLFLTIVALTTSVVCPPLFFVSVPLAMMSIDRFVCKPREAARRAQRMQDEKTLIAVGKFFAKR